MTMDPRKEAMFPDYNKTFIKIKSYLFYNSQFPLADLAAFG